MMQLRGSKRGWDFWGTGGGERLSIPEQLEPRGHKDLVHTQLTAGQIASMLGQCS